MLYDNFGDSFLHTKLTQNFAHRPYHEFFLKVCIFLPQIIVLYAEITVFLGGVYSKLFVVPETKESLFGGITKLRNQSYRTRLCVLEQRIHTEYPFCCKVVCSVICD